MTEIYLTSLQWYFKLEMKAMNNYHSSILNIKGWKATVVEKSPPKRNNHSGYQKDALLLNRKSRACCGRTCYTWGKIFIVNKTLFVQQNRHYLKRPWPRFTLVFEDLFVGHPVCSPTTIKTTQSKLQNECTVALLVLADVKVHIRILRSGQLCEELCFNSINGGISLLLVLCWK